MHQAARFEKMLAFLRDGVDKVDTIKRTFFGSPFFVHSALFCFRPTNREPKVVTIKSTLVSAPE